MRRRVEITSSMRLVRYVVVFLVVGGVLCFGPFRSFGQMEHPTPENGSCSESPPDGFAWSPHEAWAWTKIRTGLSADFNECLKLPLDVKDVEYVDKRRNLSSSFLSTILTRKSFQKAIGHRGVHIVGAHFPDEIDLTDVSIEHPLVIVKSLFDSKVTMRRFVTSKSVSFDGSQFKKTLDMESVLIAGHLSMRRVGSNDVFLSSSKIGSRFTLTGSEFQGKLDMGSASIVGDLLMDTERSHFFWFLVAKWKKATFQKRVDLSGVSVGGVLDMTGASFNGTLSLRSASIGRDLIMRNHGFNIFDLLRFGPGLKTRGSEFLRDTEVRRPEFEASFRDVDLGGVNVGGVLDMTGSRFNGTVNLTSASVEGDLLVRSQARELPVVVRSAVSEDFGRTGFKKLEMNQAKIGGDLDARGTMVCEWDLTNAQIEHGLLLESTKWLLDWADDVDKGGKCQPKLTLRDTRVGTLQDTRDAWSESETFNLELNGFTYRRFGGGETEQLYERGHEWFLDWLEKDKTYSPQPYSHLARVLRADGLDNLADAILFAGRERERDSVGVGMFKWWRLSFLRWVYGYGYGWRSLWVLVWFAGLVVIGMVVLVLSREKDRNTAPEKNGIIVGFWDSACYSLDMVLPVIRLRDAHYSRVDLTTWARYYFSVHKILGYVLTFFLLAGLTGLAR